MSKTIKTTLKHQFAINLEFDSIVETNEPIPDKALEALELEIKGGLTAMLIDDLVFGDKDGNVTVHQKTIEVHISQDDNLRTD